jgi:hypothetical protein
LRDAARFDFSWANKLEQVNAQGGGAAGENATLEKLFGLKQKESLQSRLFGAGDGGLGRAAPSVPAKKHSG